MASTYSNYRHMKLIHTDIDGVVVIEPRIFDDARGYFYESFNERELCEALGLKLRFVQDNQSRSREGVVRGLHYQVAPFAQTKLVRVVRGEILDVAVDLRRGSPTLLRHVAVRLSEDNHRQLLIPRGFAHGFVVLRGDAIVEYKCDNYYAPEAERTIAYNDPDIAIDWGIEQGRVIVSERDANATQLANAELFDYNTDYYA